MALKLVGAGIGRTGTHSLKLALETLLGGRCYHMVEVFQNPAHVPEWARAMRGEAIDWNELFADYVATVDWPGGACWREISAAFPDAIVLLSTRASADDWWRSAHATIFEGMRRGRPSPRGEEWSDMVDAMMTKRFDPRWSEEGPAKEAYERHNAQVRAAVPAGRLVEWQPGAGWEPLCAALGRQVPDEPFPHVNSTAEFRAMFGFDA